MFKTTHILLIVTIQLLLVSCTSSQVSGPTKVGNPELINYNENTVSTRFLTPEEYERTAATGFGKYLRNLPLKKKGSLVKYYDGRTKDSTGVYCAVIDQEIQKRDLHQCADAVMRQYATYLYKNKMYDKIQFTFQSGFKFGFKKWAEGYRVDVSDGGKWYKKTSASYSESTFNSYLTMVYAYCGTASLEKNDLKNVSDINDMKIGDVFIKGGHPGHAVLIIDMAENESGDQLFMIAQSYMPAQQMQVLINPNNKSLSPWYSLSEVKKGLQTPEWSFEESHLKRF